MDKNCIDIEKLTKKQILRSYLIVLSSSLIRPYFTKTYRAKNHTNNLIEQDVNKL